MIGDKLLYLLTLYLRFNAVKIENAAKRKSV
jgi:hypothetical protein